MLINLYKDSPVENQAPTFTITDTKLYVSVVTSSTLDNAQLLQQLKSGFKRTIDSNKYQLRITVQERNRYLHYLIDSSFQCVNRIFVLSFEKNTDGACYKRYYLPQAEIKDYIIMIDEEKF